MDQQHVTRAHISLLKMDVYCEYIMNDKPSIILIHGFVASSYTFNPVMSLLARDFSVIAIDLPGFGRSEKPTHYKYSYENYAKLVIACLDYFNLDTACLCGHSMGGQIALYTTRLLPHRISSLVLISCSAYLGPAPRRMIYASYLPCFHLAARYIVRKNGVKDTLKNVLYDPAFVTEELIEEYGRPLKERNFYKALVRILRHREGDLSTKELNNIQTPALLIWGEADKVVPLSSGRKLASDLPNATLKTFEKAGHLITEEKPKGIYSIMRNWIQNN